MFQVLVWKELGSYVTLAGRHSNDNPQQETQPDNMH